MARLADRLPENAPGEHGALVEGVRIVPPKPPEKPDPSPRSQFREAIVIRPPRAPGRSRIGGGKAWPLLAALLLLVLGVLALLVATRAIHR